MIIGTRGSILAVAQTEWLARELRKYNPKLEFHTKTIETSGDIAKDQPIGSLNLKGAFTKELDEALLEKRIDIAVHSLKDLPAELPKGLHLAAITKCVDPRDAFLSHSGKKFRELPSGSVVGTSSLRRKALLFRIRPDVKTELLRGNVDTRLMKLADHKFDAIVLAAAGLMRLGYENKITEFLDPLEFVPAIGQGKLAIIIRSSDKATQKAVAWVDNAESHEVALGERRFMEKMEGGCQIPLGCYGFMQKKKLTMIGFFATSDGTRSVLKTVEGDLADAISMADRLANEIRHAFK